MVHSPLAAIPILFLVGSASSKTPEDAISFGAGGCGKLQGGVALPCSGPNFEAFSSAACAMGRNYLHPLVQQTVIDAFTALEAKLSKRTWQYGEMGKESGGSLWPHKTHQNGLSADFFMPVVNKRGEPDKVSISPLNKFGYGLEFDKRGTLDELRIDWKAIADHLLALVEVGRAHGVRIERIIVTPAFHESLFQNAPALKQLDPLFMKKEAWVRHDEHYHVDFGIPEKLRRPLKCK
ncbi:MAG: penicillin-insensitive murein endopeptidase [Myxococcaceae bacterium]